MASPCLLRYAYTSKPATVQIVVPTTLFYLALERLFGFANTASHSFIQSNPELQVRIPTNIPTAKAGAVQTEPPTAFGCLWDTMLLPRPRQQPPCVG